MLLTSATCVSHMRLSKTVRQDTIHPMGALGGREHCGVALAFLLRDPSVCPAVLDVYVSAERGGGLEDDLSGDKDLRLSLYRILDESCRSTAGELADGFSRTVVYATPYGRKI